MDKKLAVGTLLAIGLLLPGPPKAVPQLVVLARRVWEVSPRGSIAPFPLLYPPGYDSEVQGATVPLPSPDGRWIAFGDFGDDYDIHLLDVGLDRERRITRFGRPPGRGHTWVAALIDGWSADSRMLLVYVTHGETIAEEGMGAVPKAPYGFYVYDPATSTTKPLTLPKEFEFIAWLRDGRFVGVLPGRLPRDDKLVILRPGEARETRIRGVFSSSAQVSTDGKWLVGLHTENGRIPGKGTAQIVKVNLATMAVTPLVNLTSWSGNERPALSPDDKHVAYKREKQKHPLYYTPQESLFVDGRLIYSCPGPIDFKWVNDRMIAVACQESVLVLNSATGKILSRHQLTPGGTSR